MVTIFLPHLAYAEIDLMMFLPTLIISLLKVKRNYKALLYSIGIVSPLYIAWDVVATANDSWSFNPHWILGLYLYDLPVEEVLFFVVTPFATLMIYDFLKGDRFVNFRGDKVYYLSGGLIALGIALLFLYSYTSIVLIFAGASLLTAEILAPEILTSVRYWEFVILTYIPFFVFDYFLTSLPVVIYGPHSILGVRIGTIPIEDAIYSFSMMNFYTTFYRVGGRIWVKN
ncbi:hypothetical protein HS7_13510 [Sulfolobales archaeon HS-7]|nr:hypothetical protein HS7_13510 [Sulfolobales archaeon HS-7]